MTKHNLGDLLYSDTFGFGYVSAINEATEINAVFLEKRYVCTWINPPSYLPYSHNQDTIETLRDENDLDNYKFTLMELLQNGY